MLHPIYEFKNISYEEGELEAIGYINGLPVTSCVGETAGLSIHIEPFQSDNLVPVATNR